MYVCAGRPAFARPCVGVHKSTSLMSSSLLLQQCPACLAHLTWIVFVMGAGGRTVGVLWGVAARTCLRLYVAFLCNCRLASFVLKTYLGRWMIGRSGERGSGISVLPARYDDDDEMYKMDLALNNLYWLICHKTKPNLILVI